MAPRPQIWWRVAWARDKETGRIGGRGKKPYLSSRMGTTGNESEFRGMDRGYSWRHKCWFPLRFYATVNHLPRKRIEIDVFKNLRR